MVSIGLSVFACMYCTTILKCLGKLIVPVHNIQNANIGIMFESSSYMRDMVMDSLHNIV